MADWTEKYRPSTLAEVRGNNKARDALAEWGKTWDDHREAVVLHGAPGVGKTSAAHALANDMGWETVELNASDQRTADVIERFAGRAAMNTTLAGASAGDADGRREGRQLVVMDEADNIHGNYDRGGAGAITRLVKKANQPIVLIANEYYDMSNGLRNATQDIEFRDVSARSIVPVLRDILRKEGIEFDSDALDRLAETNSGDLRSAVKDLQAAADGKERLTVEDVVTGTRDRAIGLFAFIDAVLKEESAEEALQSAYAVDETPDDQVQWIEDKVSLVYDDDELARAYEFLANADVWLGRVRATQDYSYWRYATDNVAAGVAAARDRTRGGWTQYGGAPYRSTRDSTRDEIVRKIAESGGFSMGTARRDVLPFLATMTHHCKPRDLTVAMAAWYDLDEAAVSYVTGSGETTNKVQSIVEDAREMRETEMEAHTGGAFEGAAPDADGGDGADTDGDANGDDAANRDDADDDVLDGNADADDRAEDAEDDDGQSGLDDFF
ncbi:replication factor C large subunit [Halogeometricum rufum]|uniref:Replication factor C large subunit n=1 Tax=Halogeometricum rufum TaxID=553469 RepID=A0A1I6HSH3_9EURY|nr:replication factor C large subunit [Halogeometricum rufum]SFR57422.1 replication factor C large subunit [Halogeometricum rufum]